MKEIPRVEWALRLLEDQLERIGELRNANPRDPGFKLWRQTTLTEIQRIWPGDLARSERFRRIPFSSMTPRATRAQAKEQYERGCAEAAGYLKALMAEIDTRGIVPPDPNAAPLKPAALPPELAGTRPAPSSEPPETKRSFDPGDMLEPSPLEDFRPPLEPGSFPGALPAELEPPAEPAAAPSADAIEPPARAEPPALPTRRPAPAPPPTPASRSASRGQPLETPVEPPRGRALPPPTPPAAPPPRSRADAPAPRGPRRPDRRALKEMLGFLDESSLTAPAPSPEATPPAARGGHPHGESLAPPPPPPAFAFGSDTGDEAGTPDHEEFRAEDLGGDFAELEAMAGDEVPPGDPEDLATAETGDTGDQDYDEVPRAAAEEQPSEGLLMPDFLSRTPAPSPGARRREPAPAQGPLEPSTVTPRGVEPAAVSPRPPDSPTATASLPRTPAATAFTALAAEVDRLGVPEGQRATAREALLDLAQQLDDESATWDTVREFLWMVADYPPLAQRAIPLLVPFLDVV